jgi:tRNA(adenine34) deaminase
MSIINRPEELNHIKYMEIALDEARKADQKGEVPVGAVMTDADGNILAANHNQTILQCDPTAHAEILVLRQVSQKFQNYRLLGTMLYVTVEPCVMCMGAIVHARISKLVFGAQDPKWGAAGSLYDFAHDTRLNHQPEIIGAVCEASCKKLMQQFFKKRRLSKSL